MKKSILLLCLCVGFLSSCLSPAFQTIEALNVECVVVEVPSMRPIAGATVSWRYVDPSGESVSFGPFTSDERGIFRVVVAEQRLVLGRVDGYFAGGYFRVIRIEAPGFKTCEWGEMELRERIDQSPTRPVEFRLQREKKPL